MYVLGNSLGQEANPLALFLWNHLGALGLIAPKILGTLTIVLLMVSLAKHAPRLKRPAQMFTVGLMAAVVINNFLVIA